MMPTSNPYPNYGYGVNLNVSTNPLLFTRHEIPVFKDESDAMNYQLGPDSGDIGLDAEKKVMWIVKTGPNGEKTVCKAYNIGDPYIPEPEPDVRSMEKKINDIEGALEKLVGRFDKFEELIK